MIYCFCILWGCYSVIVFLDWDDAFHFLFIVSVINFCRDKFWANVDFLSLLFPIFCCAPPKTCIYHSDPIISALIKHSNLPFVSFSYSRYWSFSIVFFMESIYCCFCLFYCGSLFLFWLNFSTTSFALLIWKSKILANSFFSWLNCF